ncbi:hypothetical protein DF186_16295, partial [Enterococcus hirae]
GHAVFPQPGHQALAGIVGVDRPQLGLERGGAFQLVLVVVLIEGAGEPDHGAPVHQAGRHHRRLQDLDAGRNGNPVGGPDGADAAVLDDH